MRAPELLRGRDLLVLEARHEDGDRLGRVQDVRLACRLEDGRRRYVVDGLLVGRRGFSERLGYAHGVVGGPWLVAALMRWMHRHGRYVAHEHVTTIDLEAGHVVVSHRGDADAVDHPHHGRGADR